MRIGQKAVVISAAALLSVPFIQQTASAAAITFGAAQTISGTSDVSTAGSVLYAYDLGTATGTTVNTVNFTGWAPAASFTSSTAPGNNAILTMSATPPNNSGSFTGAGNGGSTGAIGAINTASSAYYGFLDSEAFTVNSGNAQSFILTLEGLTIGTPYQVELWVDDSRGFPGNASRNETVSSGGGNNVILTYDTTGSANGVGEYAIGNFTADGTTQAITLAGGTTGTDNLSPQLGGFSLETVPEPASAGLIVLAFSALSIRRRRQA